MTPNIYSSNRVFGSASQSDGLRLFNQVYGLPYDTFAVPQEANDNQEYRRVLKLRRERMLVQVTEPIRHHASVPKGVSFEIGPCQGSLSRLPNKTCFRAQVLHAHKTDTNTTNASVADAADASV